MAGAATATPAPLGGARHTSWSDKAPWMASRGTPPPSPASVWGPDMQAGLAQVRGVGASGRNLCASPQRSPRAQMFGQTLLDVSGRMFFQRRITFRLDFHEAEASSITPITTCLPCGWASSPVKDHRPREERRPWPGRALRRQHPRQVQDRRPTDPVFPHWGQGQAGGGVR